MGGVCDCLLHALSFFFFTGTMVAEGIHTLSAPKRVKVNVINIIYVSSTKIYGINHLALKLIYNQQIRNSNSQAIITYMYLQFLKVARVECLLIFRNAAKWLKIAKIEERAKMAERLLILQSLNIAEIDKFVK